MLSLILILVHIGGLFLNNRGSKNMWVLFLLILCGIVIGSFISSLLSQLTGFSWINYGESFGLTSPIELDLGVLSVTFGFTLKITVGSIIGVALSILLYRKL